MKKLFAILAATVAVALCLVSCNKNGGSTIGGGLNGTTWVTSETYEEEGVSVTETLTLSFQATTWTIKIKATYLGQSYEEALGGGSYTYSGNTVTLTGKDEETGKDETIQGTISGNKMTFTGDELGFNGSKSITFTKQ